MNELWMAEAHFDFRWMNVHIDFFVRQFQEEKHAREYSGRHDVAIGLADRVQQEAVAHQAPIHEDVDSIAVGTLHFRPGSEPGHPERSRSLFGFKRWLGDSASHGAFCER